MIPAAADIVIRGAIAADASGIVSIYNHYVLTTFITFEETPVTALEMASRIEDSWSAALPWFVAERGTDIVGYAYATKWRTRSGYRFSAEISAYVDPRCPRLGIGSALYEKLLPTLQERGIHAVIGGIALPNEASVAFHECFGFSKVAHFKSVGFKFDRWVDVGYWQRLL